MSIRTVLFLGVITAIGCAGERRRPEGSYEANQQSQEGQVQGVAPASTTQSSLSPATQYPGEARTSPGWQTQPGQTGAYGQATPGQSAQGGTYGQGSMSGQGTSAFPGATADECEGVAQPTSCPLEQGSVQRAENIQDGVLIHLRSDVATTQEELDRRIRCFQSQQSASMSATSGAGTTGTGATGATPSQPQQPGAGTGTGATGAEPSVCLLALPGVQATVSSVGASISVTLTTTDQSTVSRLRQRARQLARRTTASADVTRAR